MMDLQNQIPRDGSFMDFIFVSTSLLDEDGSNFVGDFIFELRLENRYR